jgi:S-adenosylmethionine uptake transporter
MAMTRAYRLGNTLVTANLQYTGIVFSSIWSVLIWNDVLGWQSWAGIAVILGSGILTTFYNSRHTRATAALKAAEPDADPIAAEI